MEWEADGQRAKKRTTHIVRNRRFGAAEINERIPDFRQEIEQVSEAFAPSNAVPTTAELKDLVNAGRKGINVQDVSK